MNRIIEPAEWIFQGKQQDIFQAWHEKAIKLVNLVQAPIRLSKNKLNQFYHLILNALMGGDTAEIYFFLQKNLKGLIEHGLSFHTIQAALSDLRTLMLDVVINHPDLDRSSRNYWMSQILELFDTIHNHVQKFYFEEKHRSNNQDSNASILDKIPAVFFALDGGRFSRSGFLSKNFEQWTGISPSQFFAQYRWEDIIATKDIKQLRENFTHWQQTLLPFYSVTYAMQLSPQKSRRVHEIGRIEYSSTGTVQRVYGFFFETKTSSFRDVEIPLTVLLNTNSVDYLLFNASGKIIKGNLSFLDQPTIPGNAHTLASLFSSASEKKILNHLPKRFSNTPETINIQTPAGKRRATIISVNSSNDSDTFLLVFSRPPYPSIDTAQRMELLNNFQLESMKLEDENALYRFTIKLLKKIFPQAQGGSILVLEKDGFRFKEAFHYNLQQLKKIILLDPLKPEVQQKSIQLKAIRSSSKVIKIEDIQKQAKALLPAKAYQVLRKYGGLDDIKATLSGLVKVDDQPAAILNVDSFQGIDCFTNIDEKLMDLIVQTVSSTLKRLHILRELKQSEANYRQLFEKSPVAIYIHQDDHFKLFNPKFLEYLDITEDEARQMNIWDLVHPEDLPTLKRRATARLRGEKPLSEYEFRVINKKGEVLVALGSFSRILYNGRPAILGEVMNITRLKRLEKQLQQVQKMETIGRFTAGIAHDFNNILGAIIPGAELIAEDPVNPENKNRASIIFNMAQRGAELTQQLLSFARVGIMDKKVLNLKELILTNKNILLNTVRPSVQLQFKFGENIPNLKGDPNQLLQLILNLIINANDAIPEKGTITLSVEGKRFRQTRIGTVGVVKPGQYVILTVKDTGIGIPESIRDKIFEPFFTTKEPGKGTGLGLSTVYGIVKRHNAALSLTSKPNHGTTFRIYFPATTEAVPREKMEGASRTPIVTTTTQTILLIDDEKQLLDIVQTMLEEMGFSVITASGGKEGLKSFRKYVNQLSMVILDFSMPDMTGKEVFNEIKKHAPQIPILIATGYGEEIELQELKSSGVNHIITKPFTFEQLKKKITSVLNESDTGIHH